MPTGPVQSSGGGGKERFFLNGNIPDFYLSLILEDVGMEENG